MTNINDYESYVMMLNRDGYLGAQCQERSYREVDNPTQTSSLKTIDIIYNNELEHQHEWNWI